MKPYLLQVESVKQSLREDFLYLTEVLLKKTIPHANKQLQDTLTKYFLENYVSDLLKDKMRKNNNRAVFQEISSTISSGRPKYLKLLNAFEDKIRFFQLDSQYNSMLLILILDVGRHPRESEEWRTHTRKRMLSLLLYVHWNEQDKRDEFQSFFEMWKVAYPDNPLPQRQFKNPKIHSFDQKNMYSSQSLEEDSLYNQKNQNDQSNNDDNPAIITQPNKNKKIKPNKKDNHQQQQQQQQLIDTQKNIVGGQNNNNNNLQNNNIAVNGFNFGNHFVYNQQPQQTANGLLIHQQVHPSSLLNQNIIKSHPNQGNNGLLFNPNNVDFLNHLGNGQNQNNFLQQINKNEINDSNQQQTLSNSQLLFNSSNQQSQQHKNYFQNNNNNHFNPQNSNNNNTLNQTNPIHNNHHSHNNQNNNNNFTGNKEFIINDNYNFINHNNPIKNNGVKQESTEENNNNNSEQRDHTNIDQSQIKQQQSQQQQQNQLNFLENQQNPQFQQNIINGSVHDNTNNTNNNTFENSTNVANSGMFFANYQTRNNPNVLNHLNGGQNYSNFFQNGGASQSYNYSSGLHNQNFMNYNTNNNNNQNASINNNISNSIINMTSSYNQFNPQSNSINPKTSESQNFGINLSHDKYDKQIEKFMMDNSYNNELFLASHNMNYYPNTQNLPHITQIAAAAAVAQIQNNTNSNNPNNNNNLVNINQQNFSNSLYNCSKQNSNASSAQANSKKKQQQMIDFNQLNQINNVHNQQLNDISPVKLEQQLQLQQQQIQQQNKQNLLNSTQFLSSKIMQSTNDNLQGFVQKQIFNMTNSGQNNFTNLTNTNHHNNYANYTNQGNQLGSNIYSLGGMGFQSDIYGFFSQYYQEQKEEISWESTEPLSIYAANQAPILTELNALFLQKLNALPTIQKVKDTKIKSNNNNNNSVLVSKEKEQNECLSEIVDSYEVDQNPVSQ